MDNVFGAIARIFTDAAPDPLEAGRGMVYICRECTWRDRGGMLAASHHRATGHAVRGRDWPASFPDAVFVKPEPRRG